MWFRYFADLISPRWVQAFGEIKSPGNNLGEVAGQIIDSMAPQPGLEPGTLRLTALETVQPKQAME